MNNNWNLFKIELRTKIQILLLAFCKNLTHFNLIEKLNVFNLTCEHFPDLIPTLFLEFLEENFKYIFTNKLMIGNNFIILI